MIYSTDTDILAQFGTADFRRDPFPFLHRLREQDPVHRTAAGFYLLSRHADIAWMLGNSMTEFRSPDREQLSTQYPQAVQHISAAKRLDTLGLKNDPEHARLRKLISRDFTPRYVAGIRSKVSAACDELLDAIEAPLHNGNVIDLHTSVSIPLTLRTFAELFGISPADRQWLGDALLDITLTIGNTDEAKLAIADAQTLRVDSYFVGRVDQVRRHPRDDLVSALVSMHDDDSDRLSDTELMAMLWALLIVGFETTAAGIDLGVLALLDHPGTHYWLAGDDGRAHAFVEEVLRYGGVLVFGAIPRITTRSIRFAGTTIPAGVDVRPLLAAANRDPSAFPSPDVFDPGRTNQASLHFGHGARYCVGAAFARLQMALALQHLHQRFPTLVLAAEPTWSNNVRLRSLDNLPVALAG